MNKTILLTVLLMTLMGCGSMSEPVAPTMVPIRPGGTTCTEAMNANNYTGDALGYLELFANGSPENRPKVRDMFEELTPPRCAGFFNANAVAYMNAVLNGEPDEVINRHLINMNADLNRILNEETSDES